MQSEDRLTAILNRKPPKSVQGFEPGLLGQNPVALPLAPPLHCLVVSIVANDQVVGSSIYVKTNSLLCGY